MADTLTALALCWRIERRDGVTIGLTDHDRDLTVDGLLYRAAPGMTPSAIERSDGLEPDTMDVAGALTGAAIGEADLLAGRWDGARVQIIAADWSGEGPPALLGGGTTGTVDLSNGSFTAELSGPTTALARPVVEETSASCRAELGDRRCRVGMRARTRIAHVVGCEDTVVTLDTTEPGAGAYASGRLRWLEGPNCGLDSAVSASAGTTLTLTELKVQTSSYGTPISRLYGAMRVAGTVVWATDLHETRTRSGGGKGRPSTTSYAYSVSFAVLLSARPIVGIGRIWADGQLLRGSAGDLKVATGFRLHVGDERQDPDPLIAAAETTGSVPAMRGQAYAVFEDLQLGDYGNRIPSLTFEVFADDGPVAIGDIAADLGVATDAPGRAIAGFSGYGDSVRGVLETLADIDGGWFADRDGGITLCVGNGSSVAVADRATGADAGGGLRRRTLAAAQGAPRSIALAHYDPARDYQIGVQRAAWSGPATAGERAVRIELPAALDAGTARAVAEGMLARGNAKRERRTIAMPVADGLALRPGARVTIAGEAGRWRIARWTLERMVVRLELEPISRAPATVPASAGRVNSAPDRVHGPTILHAFEMPPIDDVVLSAPRVTVAAAGGPGWRQAALLTSRDGGASWSPAGGVTIPATLGSIVAITGAAPATLLDDRNAIEVELAHAGLTLGDADQAALDRGANLALVGDELVQFGRAEFIASRRWRLSTLLRGRRGTEWATGRQAPGDRFVLIDPEALVSIDLPPDMLGAELQVLASGVGDLAGPAAASVPVTGAAVRPPAPAGLHWSERDDGGIALHWVRRSRVGWRWIDGVDAPLAEESERYRVEIDGEAVVVDEPAFILSATRRAAGAATVRVTQIGTLAESVAAIIALPTI